MDKLAFGTELNRHLASKVSEVTGRRFCSSHQGMATLEGGVVRNKRWVCATCEHNRKTRTRTRGF